MRLPTTFWLVSLLSLRCCRSGEARPRDSSAGTALSGATGPPLLAAALGRRKRAARTTTASSSPEEVEQARTINVGGADLEIRGGAISLVPSSLTAARVANVYFWIAAVTSAADGVKAWVDVGMKVPRGSFAEWSSNRHGWILLSMLTLALLVERSSLTPPQMVVVSYVPLLYHMFEGLYSGRVAKFNIQSGDAFLFAYHAVLLVAVLGFSINVPSWMLDGLWWFAGIGGVLAPQQMMQNARIVDAKNASAADRLLFIIQGHAALVYAAAIRAASLTSTSPSLLTVMRWALDAWVAAIGVFWALRIDLGRAAGFLDAARYALTGVAVVLALLVHQQP